MQAKLLLAEEMIRLQDFSMARTKDLAPLSSMESLAYDGLQTMPKALFGSNPIC